MSNDTPFWARNETAPPRSVLTGAVGAHFRVENEKKIDFWVENEKINGDVPARYLRRADAQSPIIRCGACASNIPHK